MRKVTVELDYDAVDNIVKQELRSLRETLKEDLKKRKNGTGIAIFEVDKTTDVALIKEHVEAFNLILRYYGEKDE
jgi:ribosomal protein S8